MKKIEKLCYLLLLLILAVSSCRKDEIPTELPPATTEGANTFGCLIDGEPWVAYIKDEGDPLNVFNDKVDVQYDDEEYLRVLADFWIPADSISQSFILHCNVYPDDLNSPSFRLSTKLYDFTNPCGTFILDSSRPSGLSITRLDLEEHIVSGEFFFSLIDDRDCPETDTVRIRVTSGRFDAQYHY